MFINNIGYSRANIGLSQFTSDSYDRTWDYHNLHQILMTEHGIITVYIRFLRPNMGLSQFTSDSYD